MTEIERKFLITDSSFISELSGQKIIQSYVFNDGQRGNLRVRIYGESAYLTIKGSPSGITRSEFEYPIPMPDALALLNEFCPLEKRIEKTRYKLAQGKYTWEIDVFEGANKGLILAEIELDNENDVFKKPEWLGNEVSVDPRFFNSSLCEKPYSRW